MVLTVAKTRLFLQETIRKPVVVIRENPVPLGGPGILLRWMSVVCVQISALDVGSDVAIQRYSFSEILEIILHSCNFNLRKPDGAR